MKLKDYLISINACKDAIEWVGDRTIEQAVADCHRGDWMLWLAKMLDIDKRKLTLAKGLCANTVRHLMQDERSIKAVDAAIAYGNGGIDDVQLAAAAAYDAYVAAYASAAYAAYAAAAYASASAAYAASAAAYAASAAAACANGVAERTANQLQTADICRKYIGNLIIERFNNQTK